MVEAIVDLHRTVINGIEITAAVPPTSLWAVLGQPDRIVDPAPRAPYGHRNNQVHVYDLLGLYLHEHHFTGLISGMVFVFWPEEEGFEFTPAHPFPGRLLLGDYEVPPAALESELISRSRLPFRPVLAGHSRARSERFSAGISAKGARTASGGRSARRRVVGIDVAWPHDPWHRNP